MQNKIIKIVAIKILLALSIFLNVMIADVIEVISVGTKLSHNEQTSNQTEQKTEINKVKKDKNSNKDKKVENVKKKEETEKVTENTETNIIEKEVNEETEETNDEENKLVSLGTFKLTAYCPCAKCCGKDDGITASGTVATQGRTIACNSLPAGTEVIINEKSYIVEDTGNMGDEVIDIFFDSHQKALDFGVQYAEVFIYDN